MTELTYEDLKVGQHLWVICDDHLLMAAKLDEEGCYEVCGPWECGIWKDDCEIVELVDRPKGYENHKLYYE